MVGEARYARDGKPQVEERVEGWHEDWSHLACSWYAKGCLHPELAYPSRQFEPGPATPPPDPLSSRDRGERRQMRLVPRRWATNWREPISDTPFPRHHQRCPRRVTIFLVEKLTDWLTDWLANERRIFLPLELSSKRRSVFWKRNSFLRKGYAKGSDKSPRNEEARRDSIRDLSIFFIFSGRRDLGKNRYINRFF